MKETLLDAAEHSIDVRLSERITESFRLPEAARREFVATHATMNEVYSSPCFSIEKQVSVMTVESISAALNNTFWWFMCLQQSCKEVG